MTRNPEPAPIFDALAPHPHFALELAWNAEAEREAREAFENFEGLSGGPGLPW